MYSQHFTFNFDVRLLHINSIILKNVRNFPEINEFNNWTIESYCPWNRTLPLIKTISHKNRLYVNKNGWRGSQRRIAYIAARNHAKFVRFCWFSSLYKIDGGISSKENPNNIKNIYINQQKKPNQNREKNRTFWNGFDFDSFFNFFPCCVLI